jgi:nucleoside 2-deoxyribosyltransferase
VGAAYEMGFMRALCRPVFAYSNDDRALLRACRRLLCFCGGGGRGRASAEDGDGLAIEPFGLHDNLMLIGGVTGSGGRLVTGRSSTPRATRCSRCSNAASGSRRPHFWTVVEGGAVYAYYRRIRYMG